MDPWNPDLEPMGHEMVDSVVIVPSLGASAPPMSLSKVLLPAPLGPRIAMLR